MDLLVTMASGHQGITLTSLHNSWLRTNMTNKVFESNRNVRNVPWIRLQSTLPHKYLTQLNTSHSPRQPRRWRRPTHSIELKEGAWSVACARPLLVANVNNTNRTQEELSTGSATNLAKSAWGNTLLITILIVSGIKMYLNMKQGSSDHAALVAVNSLNVPWSPFQQFGELQKTSYISTVIGTSI